MIKFFEAILVSHVYEVAINREIISMYDVWSTYAINWKPNTSVFKMFAQEKCIVHKWE